MKNSKPVSGLNLCQRAVVLALVSGLVSLLSGCGLGNGGGVTATGIPGGGGSGGGGGSTSLTTGLSGMAHGGQQPVSGALATLWAAGTTGTYGTGATYIASTTTDSTGSFNFNNSGVSPCTTGQLLYITVTGGNPGGGTNGSSALMAALSTPCGSTTASTFVVVNEVTTVAAVWSLQQFMSINQANNSYVAGGAASTAPWQIGAPSTNVTGITNAFLNAGQLANVATGASASQTTTSTVTYPAATYNSAQYTMVYTNTINPDSARVNMVGDVLASCVNSTPSTSIISYTTSAVTSISITTNATYTTAPTITFTGGGGGSGATAVATLVPTGSAATLTLAAINVTNGGSGYTSAPTVVLSSGTAVATAVIGPQTTFTGNNQFSPDENITFSGFTGNGAALDTGTYTVLANGLSGTQFEVAGLTVTPSDTGTATPASAAGVSNTCTNLFADVVPSTAKLPIDTIQAAYDIATAPGGITQYAEPSLSSGTVAAGTALNFPSSQCSSTSDGCEWALAMCTAFVSPTPQFTTSACYQGNSTTPSASYPTDFSIGVRWSATDANGLIYGAKSGAVAIDSLGNMWDADTGTATASYGEPIVEWSPKGQVLQVVGFATPGNVAASYTMPSSTLTVYTTSTGNVESTTSGSFTYGSTPPTETLPLGSATVVLSVYGLAIDTNNNAWITDKGAGTIAAGAGGTALTGFNPGMLLKVTPATITGTGTSTAGTVTPFTTAASPAPIAIDGNNNIWVGGSSTSGGTSSSDLNLMTAASGYQTLYENQYFGSAYEQIMIDGLNNYAWALSNTSTAGKAIYRSSVSTAQTPANLTSINLAPTNWTSSPALIVNWGAIDNAGNIWVSEGSHGTSQLAYIGAQASLTPAVTNNHTTNGTATSFTNNTAPAGIEAPLALSIDGVGNLLLGNGVSATSGGISILSSTNVPLTPTNASTGMAAYGLNIFATDAPKAMAIDASGNVFTGTGSNSYEVHMVGLAAPVITPTATATIPASSTITSWSIDSSGTLATFNVNNNYTAGQIVLLSGFGTSTFFNGQNVTVQSTGLSTLQFEATVTGGTASTSATENGTASVSRLGTRP